MGRGGLCACPTEVTHNRSPRTKWPGGGVSKGVLEQYSGDVTIDWCPVEAPLKAQPETGMWVQVFYLGGELGGKGEGGGVCPGRKEANKRCVSELWTPGPWGLWDPQRSH